MTNFNIDEKEVRLLFDNHNNKDSDFNRFIQQINLKGNVKYDKNGLLYSGPYRGNNIFGVLMHNPGWVQWCIDQEIKENGNSMWYNVLSNDNVVSKYIDFVFDNNKRPRLILKRKEMITKWGNLGINNLFRYNDDGRITFNTLSVKNRYYDESIEELVLYGDAFVKYILDGCSKKYIKDSIININANKKLKLDKNIFYIRNPHREDSLLKPFSIH